MDKKQRIAESLLQQNILLKHMGIATAISTGFSEKDSQVVVMGGLAVEFYTNACFITQDIELVTSRPDRITEVMTEMGFVNGSGIWHLPQVPKVTIKLSEASSVIDQSKVVPIHIGQQSVGIIRIEDLIINRANEAIHWGRGDSAEEWIRYMMAAHYLDIDWTYLEEAAKKEQCVEVIESCRKWTKQNVEQMEKLQGIDK